MVRLTVRLYTCIQICLVSGLIWYFQYNANLLLLVIASDSLFQAIDTFSSKFAGSYANSRTGPKDSFGTEPFNIVDKYALYVMSVIIVSVIDLLTWSYLSPVWRIGLLLVTCPDLQQLLFQIAEIEELYLEIKRRQNSLLHNLGCLLTSRIINKLSTVSLGSNPQITRVELLTVSPEYVWRFIKMFMINSLVKIAAQRDQSYTTRALQYLYRRGHLVEIPPDHGSFRVDKDNRQVLKKVISGRQWHYLYDPRVLDHLIDLYNESSADNQLVDSFWTLVDNFNDCLMRFCTIWTVCSFFNNDYLMPFVSIALTGGMALKWNSLLRVACYVAVLTGYTSYFYSAFVSEFSSLLDNSVTHGLVSGLYELTVGADARQLRKLLCYLTHQNSYNLDIIVATSCLIACRVSNELVSSGPKVSTIADRLDRQVSSYVALISLFGCFIFAIRRWQNLFVYLWMVGWGLFSHYHPIHVTCLGVILYLVINLADYKNIPEPLLRLDLYNSYYGLSIQSPQTDTYLVRDEDVVNSYRIASNPDPRSGSENTSDYEFK
jgi:hypothetical protein